MLRRAALAAMFLLALSTVSVAAVSPVVTISGNHFSPTPFNTTLGGLVHWSNSDGVGHTSTADQFALWDIAVAAHTESGDAQFLRAGTFAYHCKIHGSMRGQIRVPMNVSASSGPINTPFLITVATANAPAGWTQDIQKHKGSKPFRAWRSITGQSVNFTPLTVGTYQFRTRYRQLSTGIATLWSPTVTIVVNLPS